MNIGRNECLAEIRLIEIRNFLRKYWIEGSFSILAMVRHFRITKEKSLELLQVLIESGWVEKNENGRYIPTDNAGPLIMAKATKPVPRERAQQTYNDFMNRVLEVNRNPYYLFYVKKVILFGSFLTGASEVGDVDLAIECFWKDMGEGVDATKVTLERAKASGKHSSSILGSFDFAYQEVKLFLKNRSRILSFHPSDDPVLKKCPTRVVFECVNRPGIF